MATRSPNAGRLNPVDFGVLSANYGYGTSVLSPVDSGLYRSGVSGASGAASPGAKSGYSRNPNPNAKAPAGLVQAMYGIATNNPVSTVIGFTKLMKSFYDSLEASPEALGVTASAVGYSPAADSQAASEALGEAGGNADTGDSSDSADPSTGAVGIGAGVGGAGGSGGFGDGGGFGGYGTGSTGYGFGGFGSSVGGFGGFGQGGAGDGGDGGGDGD